MVSQGITSWYSQEQHQHKHILLGKHDGHLISLMHYTNAFCQITSILLQRIFWNYEFIISFSYEPLELSRLACIIVKYSRAVYIRLSKLGHWHVKWACSLWCKRSPSQLFLRCYSPQSSSEHGQSLKIREQWLRWYTSQIPTLPGRCPRAYKQISQNMHSHLFLISLASSSTEGKE